MGPRWTVGHFAYQFNTLDTYPTYCLPGRPGTVKIGNPPLIIDVTLIASTAPIINVTFTVSTFVNFYFGKLIDLLVGRDNTRQKQDMAAEFESSTHNYNSRPLGLLEEIWDGLVVDIQVGVVTVTNCSASQCPAVWVFLIDVLPSTNCTSS